MSSPVSNNKRIVKNTLYMYVRMLFVMGIGLYTSRVVLSTLGVADFGIYNVVGGVVVFFSFINRSMTTSTQRYLSYELGKPDGNISSVFSSCLFIHICLSVLILLVLETIGLWFLNYKMNFPEGRMTEVNWCYQFSVFSCFFSIVKAPYSAVIVAKEKFSFYAYLGIIEAVLKLTIVYLLLCSNIDRLVLYSILMFGVGMFTFFLCVVYCIKVFPEVRHVRMSIDDKHKDILSFSGWAFFGSLANVGLSQGINVIINMFYGVFVNAAFGIANQVNNQITALVSSFQQAMNPQLTKSEAEGNRERQFSLICLSSKFSFFITLIVVFPLILNLDYILRLWLGEYPEHTYQFCIAVFIGVLIDSFSGPLWVTIFATGKIKRYQICISAVLLLLLPMSYFAGDLGVSPETIFYLRNIIYVAAFLTRLYFLKYLINFSLKKYLEYSILPTIYVSVLLVPILLFAKSHFFVDKFNMFIIIVTLSILLEILIIYWIGLNCNERTKIKGLIMSKFNR